MFSPVGVNDNAVTGFDMANIGAYSGGDPTELMAQHHMGVLAGERALKHKGNRYNYLYSPAVIGAPTSLSFTLISLGKQSVDHTLCHPKIKYLFILSLPQ